MYVEQKADHRSAFLYREKYKFVETFGIDAHRIECGNEFWRTETKRSHQYQRRETARKGVRSGVHLSRRACSGDRRTRRARLPLGESRFVRRTEMRYENRLGRGVRGDQIRAEVGKEEVRKVGRFLSATAASATAEARSQGLRRI